MLGILIDFILLCYDIVILVRVLLLNTTNFY